MWSGPGHSGWLPGLHSSCDLRLDPRGTLQAGPCGAAVCFQCGYCLHRLSAARYDQHTVCERHSRIFVVEEHCASAKVLFSTLTEVGVLQLGSMHLFTPKYTAWHTWMKYTDGSIWNVLSLVPTTVYREAKCSIRVNRSDTGLNLMCRASCQVSWQFIITVYHVSMLTDKARQY